MSDKLQFVARLKLVGLHTALLPRDFAAIAQKQFDQLTLALAESVEYAFIPNSFSLIDQKAAAMIRPTHFEGRRIKQKCNLQGLFGTFLLTS